MFGAGATCSFHRGCNLSLRERFQCLLPDEATRYKVAPLVARVSSRLSLFPCPIMFERNSVSLLRESVEGCPILEPGRDRKVPIVRSLCGAVEIDLIVHNQTLFLVLLVNHPEVLPQVHQD